MEQGVHSAFSDHWGINLEGYAGSGTAQESLPLWMAYTPHRGSSPSTLVLSDVHPQPFHTAAMTLGNLPLTLCSVITDQSPSPLAQHTRCFTAG